VFSITPYNPGFQKYIADSNYNIFGKEIVRYSLGYMVGAMLSWISLFSLFFAFAVAPLMDAALDLKQIEATFYLEEAYARPSVIRYIVASLRRGLFPKEDRFVALAERLSALKDVGTILRLQQTIRSTLVGLQ